MQHTLELGAAFGHQCALEAIARLGVRRAERALEALGLFALAAVDRWIDSGALATASR